MASPTSISSPLIAKTTFFFFFLRISSSSSSSSSSALFATTRGGFSKIYAFGDSLTDTGNTRSATGPTAFVHVSNPPYGTTFFHHPTNRYSDGRLVVDFLANALSLPFLPPYLNRKADFSHGVNFAVAGSTAIDYSFYVKNNVSADITPVSINTQLQWFNKFLERKGCRGNVSRKCRAAIDGALFWVGEIGANDYAYSFASSVPSSTIQNNAIKNVGTFLQALLEKGAKYVVVQGLPLTGCLPLALTLASTDNRDDIGCVASTNKQSYMHNFLLQAKIRELRRRHPNAIISYADFWHAHQTVMKNATKYGFKELFKTCCGTGGGALNFDLFTTCGSPNVLRACADPSKFVNWDGVHLTEATYAVTADLLLRRGYSQPPFESLLTSKRRGG